jgi:hypothetical protein
MKKCQWVRDSPLNLSESLILLILSWNLECGNRFRIKAGMTGLVSKWSGEVFENPAKPEVFSV